MKIPKILKRENRKYIFVKCYKNYVLYEETSTGIKECFNRNELGLIQEKEKTRKINPENVTFL